MTDTDVYQWFAIIALSVVNFAAMTAHIRKRHNNTTPIATELRNLRPSNDPTTPRNPSAPETSPDRPTIT